MSTTPIKNIVQYIKAILKNQDIINFSNIAENINQWDLTRTLCKEFQIQKLIWNFFASIINITGAYLVIDDTILDKPYSKASRVVGAFIRWVWSHKHNKSIKGIQIVFLLMVIGKIRFPIGFKIYDKSKTKITLALELLSYARNVLKLKGVYVLFDSWYSSKNLLKRIKDYGWYFVCRIKRNRKVSGIKVKNIWSNPYGIMRGMINNMDVILVRNRKHYIITNRLSLTKEDIIDWYSKRSVIEEFFKVIKHKFKLKCCQSRLGKIWENHISLVIFCFLVVELKRIELGVTIYKARKSLKFGDYTSMIQKWERFLVKA